MVSDGFMNEQLPQIIDDDLKNQFERIGGIVSEVLPNGWASVLIEYMTDKKTGLGKASIHFNTDEYAEVMDLLRLAWNNSAYAEAAADITKICRSIKDTLMLSGYQLPAIKIQICRNGSFTAEFQEIGATRIQVPDRN